MNDPETVKIVSRLPLLATFLHDCVPKVRTQPMACGQVMLGCGGVGKSSMVSYLFLALA